MQAHHTKAIVDANGNLRLEKLPFSAGETVEVLVYPTHALSSNGKRYPLRGTTIQYKDPTLPVAETDWEANR